MTPEIEQYIESQGWIIECESPLEMRHEDSSFATYNAAEIIIKELTKEYHKANRAIARKQVQAEKIK